MPTTKKRKKKATPKIAKGAPKRKADWSDYLDEGFCKVMQTFTKAELVRMIWDLAVVSPFFDEMLALDRPLDVAATAVGLSHIATVKPWTRGVLAASTDWSTRERESR